MSFYAAIRLDETCVEMRWTESNLIKEGSLSWLTKRFSGVFGRAEPLRKWDLSWRPRANSTTTADLETHSKTTAGGV
jgi:hypothetical protein